LLQSALKVFKQLHRASEQTLFSTKMKIKSHLKQLCLTENFYWAKNYVTASTRAAHCMAYFDLSKL